MPGQPSYDALRLKRLQTLLDATLGPVQQLGPHGSAVEAPPWLKDFVLALLREMESTLPEPNYFKGLIPGGNDDAAPSSLVGKATSCWEIGILLNLASNAIRNPMGPPEEPFGFAPRGKSQSEK